MKKEARVAITEAPRYPTLLQARSVRGALAAGLGALLLAPLAGCLEATPASLGGAPAADAGAATDASVEGDAGMEPDAGPDAGTSSAGDAVQEDGGV